MKKYIITAMILFLGTALFAQAPELKNMIPNSWQKLTRLSEQEEKEFFEKDEVQEAILSIDNFFFRKKKIEEMHYQIFTETNCGLQFYRFLISVSPLESIYNTEYKNKAISKEECFKMQGEENCIWQIVFLKNKNNVLQKILIRSYSQYWVSQGEWEGYHFNDLMIKPLNKNEIGFFITEVSVAFTADRKKINENIVPITYHTCKKQIDASSSTWFSKYNIKDDITSAWSKEGINIQASESLFDPKCPLKYSIQNAFDGNPATSFMENTEDDLMQCIFRKINIRKDLQIKFAIINGYTSDVFFYKANNRIKKCGLKNGDNSAFLSEITDGNTQYQTKTLIRTNDAYMELFEFIVEELYLGNQYNDSCIAELNFFDNKEHSWLFGEINE